MRYLVLAIAAFFFTILTSAQQEPIKIVFDVGSEDPEVHKTAARHLKAMSEAYPESQFEMVVYSGAYDLVTKKNSVAGETLEKAAQRDNVAIVVCQQTLDRHKLGMEDLIPGIRPVPDGIYELIAKQQQGWGYIKESR
jgi:hypothetical protein